MSRDDSHPDTVVRSEYPSAGRSDDPTSGCTTPISPERRIAGAIRTHVDGVTVCKEIGQYDDHLKVAFAIASRRPDRVRVSLVDLLPPPFPVEEVGFHDDYHGDRWTASRGGRVRFDRNLNPDERIVTLYGIRGSDEARAQAFDVPPIVEVETPDRADEQEQESIDELEMTMSRGFETLAEEVERLTAEVESLQVAVGGDDGD